METHKNLWTVGRL